MRRNKCAEVGSVDRSVGSGCEGVVEVSMRTQISVSDGGAKVMLWCKLPEVSQKERNLALIST